MQISETAGHFLGSFVGLRAEANSGTGVIGISESGIGAFLRGPIAALELGGSNTSFGAGDDDCVIRTQRFQLGGDLFLVSNDEIVLHLDDDGSETGNFTILDSDNTQVLNLNEAGDLTKINTIQFGGIISEYSSTSDPDDGVIKAPSDGGSDLFLVSNDDVAIHLDDNTGSSGLFQIYNGVNSAILTLDESGDLSVDGIIDLGVSRLCRRR